MLQASGRMVQAVEKASHEDAQADGAEFDRPNPISSGSRRSSPERDPAPPCRSREGQEVATGGMAASPPRRHQEALEVLPGRDQQPLDARVQQASDPHAPAPNPVIDSQDPITETHRAIR